MEWLGWLVALVATGVALQLWRGLAAERRRTNGLLCEKINSENRLDELKRALAERAGHVAPEVAHASFARSFGEPVAGLREQLRRAEAEFLDYRGRVERFDAAVQYCLQPVELILGADKSTLDEVMRHVEGARRNLFEARAALVAHGLHRNNPEAGAQALAELEARLHPNPRPAAPARGPARAAG